MFEVKKHLIKVQGNRLYLPVAARLVWFRQEHPDWGIETRPVVIDMEKQYAIFEAKVYNADGKLMAQGTKMENVRGFPDFIEKAETGSIGRALAVCGFGTQFAPDLDEVPSGRVVDAPQPNRSPSSRPDNGRDHDYGYRNGNGNGNGDGSGNGNGNGRGGAPALNGNARPGISDGRGPDRQPVRPVMNGVNDRAGSNGSEERRDEQKPEPVGSSETAAAQGEKQPAGANLECSICSRSLTKGQELLSIRKFGVALCPECQKERRAVEAAA